MQFVRSKTSTSSSAVPASFPQVRTISGEVEVHELRLFSSGSA